MQVYARKPGEEQPYWPLGPFHVRLPFVHYRLEAPELIQGAIMFVIALAMIPLLERYLGLPYDVALAFVTLGGVGFLLPALLGVPLVPGWITPAIPVVLIFLGQFEPGPEAIRALFALQFLVFAIFLVLGLTGMGQRLVELVPASLKAGIIIGAGIAAILGEIQEGGRFWQAPAAMFIGTVFGLFLMFSLSFKRWTEHHPLAKSVAQYGIVPAMVLAMLISWTIGEFPLPDIDWSTPFEVPAMGQVLDYTPVTLGFPPVQVFILAVPTAIIAYIIAFGDIVVGKALIDRVDHLRTDEAVNFDTTRVHLVTAIRNGWHAILAPFPGLAGPIWTGGMATVAERYSFGPKAMDSIYSGSASLQIAMFLCLFVSPLIDLFKPVLPIGLSLTLFITGYVCIVVGINEIKSDVQRGVAGMVAVTLASGDQFAAAYAIALGLVLHVLVERQSLLPGRTERTDTTSAPASEPAGE